MKSQTIPTADVIVSDDRFREANKSKVQDIAESLKRFGQLQPIIVREDTMELVDGLHRLMAHRLGKIETITVVYRDEVDELFLKEMELEANIQRMEMSWIERERAIAQLHKMKVERDPNWSMGQTAAIAGARGQADVSEAVLITKMTELFPEIGEAKSKNQALSWAKAKAKNIMRVEEVKKNVVDYSALEPKLVLGNSVEVIKALPSGFADAIITDPPFGINYDDRKAGSEGALTAYEDDKDSYERLLSMAPDMYRILKKDGWLIWFLGISWYERCKIAFREAGFIVDEIPIIWDRTEGHTFTTRPDRYFSRGYDIALHCLKGDPQMVIRNKSNILRIPPVGNADRELMVERPVELYAELIRRLTHPKEMVVDFFTGSGSCLAAAASLGRDFFGVEMNPERRAVALKKIRAHIPE